MNSAPVGPERGTRVLTVTTEVRLDPKPSGEIADGLLLQGWKVYASGPSGWAMIHPDQEGVVVYLLEAPEE